MRIERPRAVVSVDDEGSAALMADIVFVEEKPAFSELLGPDGKRLGYERQPFGFDLRRAE